LLSFDLDSGVMDMGSFQLAVFRSHSMRFNPERVTQQSLGSPHRGAPQEIDGVGNEPQRGSTRVVFMMGKCLDTSESFGKSC